MMEKIHSSHDIFYTRETDMGAFHADCMYIGEYSPMSEIFGSYGQLNISGNGKD